VQVAGPPVRTRRGLCIRAYTASCPVDGRHRMRVEQITGGAVFSCPDCDLTESRHERLGVALERLTGFVRVEHAHAR
jgi:hypothetical protein